MSGPPGGALERVPLKHSVRPSPPHRPGTRARPAVVPSVALGRIVDALRPLRPLAVGQASGRTRSRAGLRPMRAPCSHVVKHFASSVRNFPIARPLRAGTSRGDRRHSRGSLIAPNAPRLRMSIRFLACGGTARSSRCPLVLRGAAGTLAGLLSGIRRQRHLHRLPAQKSAPAACNAALQATEQSQSILLARRRRSDRAFCMTRTSPVGAFPSSCNAFRHGRARRAHGVSLHACEGSAMPR
jgi:hypothetical protein